MKAFALQVAVASTGHTIDALLERQREARQPSFEKLHKHFTTWPTEREVIEASSRHLTDEEREELVKLATDAPKRRRRRRKS